jgi:hypothetical protein
MQILTVTANFELLLPTALCESMRIMPGQKFQAIQIGDRIELIPQQDIRHARGFLKGIDTNIQRENDRL